MEFMKLSVDGPMELGIILFSPFEPRAMLNPNSVVERIRPVEEENEPGRILDGKAESMAYGGWFTRTMQTILAGEPFGPEAKADKTAHQEYHINIDSVCRRTFELSTTHVEEVWASDLVQYWLRQRSQRIKRRTHLFLVTGLLIANGTDVYVADKTSRPLKPLPLFRSM